MLDIANLYCNISCNKNKELRGGGKNLKKKNLLARLMGYAGNFKVLMVLSWVFSAVGGVISVGTYLCIYQVAQGIVLYGQNVPTNELAHYGWQALTFTTMAFGTYGLGLMLSHLTAFNMMSKIRILLIRHLGNVPLEYHSENTSGGIRKTIEKSVESIENFVAHQMPDTAQSMLMPVAFLISMFYFDWRMSLVCLIPIVIGFLALSMMLKGEGTGLIDNYQNALGEMSAAGVEYVRGISVVKVFGQTVHSFIKVRLIRRRYYSVSYFLLCLLRWFLLCSCVL